MICTSVSHLTRARHYPPHSHGEYQMIFVVRGEVRLSVSGSTYSVAAPAVMLLGNLETHSFESVTDEYERYTVTLSPAEARSAIDARLLAAFLPHGGQSPILALEADAAAEMRMLFSALAEECESPSVADGADTLVRTVLVRLLRHVPDAFPQKADSAGGLIEEVRRALESDLAEKLPLSALGERFHVSVYHLERLFRAQTGYSIGRYRLLCRIALARELLATTDLPVSEIAARAGVEDASNFARYFRRETGLSPQQYRRKAH